MVHAIICLGDVFCKAKTIEKMRLRTEKSVELFKQVSESLELRSEERRGFGYPKILSTVASANIFMVSNIY